MEELFQFLFQFKKQIEELQKMACNQDSFWVAALPGGVKEGIKEKMPQEWGTLLKRKPTKHTL